jgi:translocation and assembly module TamB
MRRLLHSSWIALVALLMVSLAALYWLGWTESGLQFLTTKLSRPIGPVTMSFEGARGTLAGGLHVDRFVLDHRRVHIEATDVEAGVSTLHLFALDIHIKPGAKVARLLIRVLPKPDDNPDWQPHFLRGPLVIDVAGIHIAQGTLIASNGYQMDAAHLQASGLIRNKSIRVYSGQLEYGGLQLQADGMVKAAAPIGLSGSLHLAANPAGQPGWLANASFDGDLKRLAIRGALTQPLAATFDGAAHDLTGAGWNWLVQAQLRQLDLRAWNAGNALGVITGSLKVSGDHDGLHADGQLTAPGLKAGPLAVKFGGHFADHTLMLHTLELLHSPSGAQLDASGTIGIAAGGPRLDLQGNWKSFRWPLADKAAPVRSANGAYHLYGQWPYSLHASGALRVLDLPELQLNADGRLSRDRITVDKAELNIWGGKATLQGETRWQNASWKMSGQMQAMSLEKLRPTVPGLLNFRFEAQGSGFSQRGTLLARIHDVSGLVRGQRAGGQAQLERSGQDWLLSGVRLQLGSTHLNADGRVGTRTDLRFDVEASDLALLHDGARGQLRARGSVRDNPGHLPTMTIDASGSGIIWDALTIGSLATKVDFSPQEHGRADAQLQIRALRYGQRAADSVQFSSNGTTAAHRVAFQLDAPQLHLRAGGNAGLINEAWDWSITDIRAEDGGELQLSLDTPTHLHVTATDQVLDRLCLHGTQSRLCGQASNRGGARAVSINAENLPMRSLTAGLADTTEFDGTLGFEAGATAAPNGVWLGRLRAQLSAAAIRHRLNSSRVETFSLGSGDVSLDLDARGLRGTAELNAGEAGKISGQATAQTTSEAWQDWPLAGNLQLESNALDLLDSYIPEIDRATGHVTASLKLDGTLAQPQISGDLHVRDAMIGAYQVNLALRNLNVDAQLRDNSLSLQGSATAGIDGRAQFTGNLRWQDKQPYGNLHLSGESLLIVNIPEAKIYASPDVDLRIAGRRIDVSGNIELPYARLERPDTLASAVRPSGDEVLINRRENMRAERTQVYTNVTLKLGERVTINTSGLQGRLSGNITAISDETGFSRGSGELNVEEGKYTAYGRKLDITRGRLLFKNSSLGDPGVDLRAVKQFPDVTAGVNVRGSLVAPSVTFFSDPTIPQSQIVSLLLAGGTLDTVQGGGTSATARTNAASASMLLQGSAILAQQFGNRLGTDISVEQTLQNDTALVLGRYLSPRLYISYGIGLAEAINTIKMTYTINDKWTLRTEAGQARSADLVYTIKK